MSLIDTTEAKVTVDKLDSQTVRWVLKNNQGWGRAHLQEAMSQYPRWDKQEITQAREKAAPQKAMTMTPQFVIDKEDAWILTRTPQEILCEVLTEEVDLKFQRNFDEEEPTSNLLSITIDQEFPDTPTDPEKNTKAAVPHTLPSAKST